MSQTTIHVGHVIDVLRGMEAESAQCVVTSPPYWGLRDYGLEGQVWDGDAECEHVWGDELPEAHKSNRHIGEGNLEGGRNHGEDVKAGSGSGQFCQRCGAWLGSLGLEPTPELYVAHLVDVFREVWRVLRKDGVVWLNLGDSYHGSWGNSGKRPELDGNESYQREKATDYFDRGGYREHRERPPSSYKHSSLKPKDLCMIPARVAIALQDAGWWVRSRVTWIKANPMPESVTDRPTSATEDIYLLSRSARYYYDTDAVREGYAGVQNGKAGTFQREGSKREQPMHGQGYGTHRPNREDDVYGHGGRNMRNYMLLPTQPFPCAYCKGCESLFDNYRKMKQHVDDEGKKHYICPRCGKWDQWMSHFATYPQRLIEPFIKAGSKSGDTVLDIFGGAGTTALVAAGLGRDSALVELNSEYAEMAKQRLVGKMGLLNKVEVMG